jgi:N6-adenosine-specific RNA methylase IME4
VRELVERFSPAPRLELFGRRVVPGWVVWGNEREEAADGE